MTERTRYQEKIIKNYYQNRDAISLQRVQELVTDLYLTEGKKLEKCWESLESHLQKLGVKETVIKNVMTKRDPQQVARLVQELSSK